MTDRHNEYKLAEDLRTAHANIDRLNLELRARDLADHARLEAAKPKPNWRLQNEQKSIADQLADPVALEKRRHDEWMLKRKMFDPMPPKDTTAWPDGTTAEIYLRRYAGLNDAGDALLGETPIVEGAVKLSPELEAAIQRAKNGGRP